LWNTDLSDIPASIRFIVHLPSFTKTEQKTVLELLHIDRRFTRG
jgi:hypothetical protein